MDLLRVCLGGKLSAVKRLTTRPGVDIDRKNVPQGFTALLCASEGGYVQVMRYLVEERHANVNLKDFNCTSLYFASMLSLLVVVRCLSKEWGTDVHIATNNGETPLYAACQEGHPDIVRLVVELGADVHFATNTAVHCMRKRSY